MAIYTDMVVCDLRHLNDVEAIKQIEEIFDVVTLVLPNDASPEVMSAITQIPKRDIANIVYVSAAAKVMSYSGIAEITESSFFDKEVVVISNGITVISGVNPEIKIHLFINGISVINKKAFNKSSIFYSNINGIKIEAEFDNYKLFSNKIEIDSDMIKYLEPDTAIIAGNGIIIADDVTIDTITEKGLKFIAGNEISCNRKIAGYIKAVSTVGNEIRVRE